MIPPELVEWEQWVVWRAEARDDRVTKVPYRPGAPQLRASVDDPTSWGTYHQARRVPGVDGIGFVFTAEDPYTGIDLDNCISSSGMIHEAAAEIVKALGGYVEPSPSGRGLHIIVRAEHRGERHRTSDTPWGGVLEIYDRRRYFTISDRGVGAPSDRQHELNRVVDELLPATGKEVNRPGVRAAVALDDQELLDRMFASRRGADIRALYEGAGRDPSAGDLALCNHLAFWFGPDPERIDRVFRSSARMRNKWERADYRARTIDRALAATTDCYAPRRSHNRERVRDDGIGVEL